MLTEDYVSFEIAKLLKEKEFDCNTNCYYIENSVTKTLFYSPISENHNASIKNNKLGVRINISSGKMSAPTLQMAMKFLREVHKIAMNIGWGEVFEENYQWWCIILNQNSGEILRESEYCKTYEEATEEAIKYCLENLI